MDIEKDIFKRSRVVYEKLIPYGFTKEKKKYKLSKNILDNAFRVDIEIAEKAPPQVKVYDLSFDEEYINYRRESETGEFVNKVRGELQKILTDIKDNCTITNYFISNQANRIASLIFEKYNDIPEFAWEKFPLDGIFKNPSTNKWYALIMNINKSKITPGNEDVDILNVKLAENVIKSLLTKKGFYQAYHMNKKNWLTIILDDTLPDEEIMYYIAESHKFT